MITTDYRGRMQLDAIGRYGCSENSPKNLLHPRGARLGRTLEPV